MSAGFIVAAVAFVVTAAANDDLDESNGIGGKVTLRRERVTNGTAVLSAYLELKRTDDVVSPLRVAIRAHTLTFRVVDADGREVRMWLGGASGPVFDTFDLVIPREGSIRFRIDGQSYGPGPDQAASLDLGREFNWNLPRDGKAYFLETTLNVADSRAAGRDDVSAWHGRLELPSVRIPTEPEPIDPDLVGPLIDQLGARMLSDDARVWTEAERRLSLIDDPRVTPWYAKAVAVRNSEMRWAAIDRLSRLAGDEAFAGLKIGLATQPEDIGNASPEAAAGSAQGIRRWAVQALERSPHPKAKALLWTLENDDDSSVRLTVIQAAWRVETPEALEILRRGTRDPDPRNRGEAERLLVRRERRP